MNETQAGTESPSESKGIESTDKRTSEGWNLLSQLGLIELAYPLDVPEAWPKRWNAIKSLLARIVCESQNQKPLSEDDPLFGKHISEVRAAFRPLWQKSDRATSHAPSGLNTPCTSGVSNK